MLNEFDKGFDIDFENIELPSEEDMEFDNEYETDSSESSNDSENKEISDNTMKLFESDGSLSEVAIDFNNTDETYTIDDINSGLKNGTKDEIERTYKSKDNSENLISQSVTRVISGEKVNTIMTDTESAFEHPNYLIDLGSIQIAEFEYNTLSCLLDDVNSDCAIYIKIGDKALRLGYGESQKLDDVLVVIIKYAFGNETKVYRNFDINKNNRELKSKDINSVVLKI